MDSWKFTLLIFLSILIMFMQGMGNTEIKEIVKDNGVITSELNVGIGRLIYTLNETNIILIRLHDNLAEEKKK